MNGLPLAGVVPGRPPADPALVERVRTRLIAAGSAPSRAAVAAAVRAEHRTPIGAQGLLALTASLHAELAGAGPLGVLLADPAVTDVLVNGPDEVWVEDGGGLRRVDCPLGGDVAVRRLAQRLAAACGRRLDDASPFVDAQLEDGTRLHAALPPVAVGAVHLSLRTFRPRAFSLEELAAAGAFPAGGAEVLHAVVRARLAFLVAGGTGAGKTTLLAAMLGAVPPGERLVVVEDATELRPAHPHLVRLQARPPNAEGAGGIALRELVRQALRMRPDRLVVGECRGAEVVELLAALNTGHGGAGTLHANSAEDIPARMEALAALGGLSRDALHAQLSAAVQVAVQVARTTAGRIVTEVGVLESGPDGRVRVLPAWTPDARPTLPGRAALRTLLGKHGVQPPGDLL